MELTEKKVQSKVSGLNLSSAFLGINGEGLSIQVQSHNVWMHFNGKTQQIFSVCDNLTNVPVQTQVNVLLSLLNALDFTGRILAAVFTRYIRYFLILLLLSFLMYDFIIS